MTIYRGYNITKNEDGSYGIHSGGSFAPVAETFPTEEAAMDFIDAQRKAARSAGA